MLFPPLVNFSRSAEQKVKAAVTRNRRKCRAGYLGIHANKTNDNSYLGDVLVRPVPVSTFWRYHVFLQRKKRCQQIIGLNDESSSIAVHIHAKEQSALGEMFGDAVRPALCV